MHFDITSVLILTAEIYSNNGCTIVWTVENSSISIPGDGISSGLKNLSPKKLAFVSLILKPNILSAFNKIYDFSIRCGQVSSLITVFPNAPPRNGYLHVSPQIGYEVQTMFTFSAGAWLDENLPLVYQFSYKSYAANFFLAVGSLSISNITTSFLPAGSLHRAIF